MRWSVNARSSDGQYRRFITFDKDVTIDKLISNKWAILSVDNIQEQTQTGPTGPETGE